MLGNKKLDYQFIITGGQIDKVVQDKVYIMSLNVGSIENKVTTVDPETKEETTVIKEREMIESIFEYELAPLKHTRFLH